MLFIRFLVLVLILVFFVLALIGTLTLPVYSRQIKDFDQDGKIRVSLWYIDVSKVELSGANATVVPTSEAVRINYAGCSEFRATFRAMQAFSIACTIFSFYAFLTSCLQCFCRLKAKLPLFLFVLLAFISELLLVIIGGMAYATEFCKSVDHSANLTSVVFKGAGYQLDRGYIIQIVTTVGLLITLILIPFTQELWCGKS
ncbi:hypothetical protein ABL78_6796 [Leptomonas seymouri]|uniref:Amastin-like protein n=1 Tax=Leptomonas seymouri TaxID=5684 RepID=A0A0N1I0C3_LEPSE|nr:hypothetical protein ABL78_6796 [Leptomonas seymouri]|eukprot:KPI84150.1 hypothetical protein ABL78_6796 [Leptomonas seymouri]